jgi:hypothetical protein
VPTVQVDSAVCVAGPLTCVIPAVCALSRQRGRTQHPSQVVLVPTVQVDSAVCVAGPLTCVIPAVCALSRQRGREGGLFQNLSRHAACECFHGWLAGSCFFGFVRLDVAFIPTCADLTTNRSGRLSFSPHFRVGDFHLILVCSRCKREWLSIPPFSCFTRPKLSARFIKFLDG